MFAFCELVFLPIIWAIFVFRSIYFLSSRVGFSNSIVERSYVIWAEIQQPTLKDWWVDGQLCILFLKIPFLPLSFCFQMILQLVTKMFLASCFRDFAVCRNAANCLRVHRNDFAQRSKFTPNHHFVKPAVEFYFVNVVAPTFSSSHMILFVTCNYLGGVMPYLESDFGEMRGKEGRQMEDHMQQGSPARHKLGCCGSWSAPEPLHHQAAHICLFMLL